MAYALIDVMGGADTYSVPFPYINRAHVKVMVNGVLTTSFSWVNDATITITPTPTEDDAVRIYRDSKQDERLVDYRAGNAITEANLDTDSLQAFYLAQEALDRSQGALSLDPTDFQWDVEGRKMKNVAPATADEDVPLFGQIRPSVLAAEAARDAAQAALAEAEDVLADTEVALAAAVVAQGAAEDAAELAETFIPDNYYTEAEVDALLAPKADEADVLALSGGTRTVSPIVVSGAADPVTARNTENDAFNRQLVRFERGDGTGKRGDLVALGDSSNGLVELAMRLLSSTGVVAADFRFREDGRLTLGANPSLALDAATKQYVDALQTLLTPWSSGELSWASSGGGTLNHNLGSSPARVAVFAKCLATEGNYNVGEIVLAEAVQGTGGSQSWGVWVEISGTNTATYRVGNLGIVLGDKTTGVQFSLTPAKWAIIIKLWKL